MRGEVRVGKLTYEIFLALDCDSLLLDFVCHFDTLVFFCFLEVLQLVFELVLLRF